MELQCSYLPNYLSIEDILATNERVPVKFLNELPRMGFLDPSSDNENLKAGTSIELPFWLTEAFVLKRPPMVSVELPKVYKEAYREILKAEASAVDLHKLGMFYYEFGSHCASFDPRGGVGGSLESTFRSRFRYLMNLCQNSEPDPVASCKLDRLELGLLEAGQRAGTALTAWCSKATTPLETAPMVDTHLKRKRAQLEEN